MSFHYEYFNRALYRSFVVPGSFMARINLPATMCDTLGILFSYKYEMDLIYINNLMSGEMASRIVLKVYFRPHFTESPPEVAVLLACW